MAREEDYGEHEDGTSTEAEGTERLEQKWWWRKEWLGSRSNPPFKGWFGEEHVMARGVRPGFTN
jgi:hypothetical protein